MKVYNNQNQKKQSNGVSQRRCGYCGTIGHVQSACVNAINDWTFWTRHELPLKDPRCWALSDNRYGRYYRQPSEWGKWYLACQGAIQMIEKAKERQNQSGSPRRTSKCGFCGDTEHNRRACPEMNRMIDRLVIANQNWRQRFYDRFVTDLGLSIGAVVEVETETRGLTKATTNNNKQIGIITSINWDELSMFCYTDNTVAYMHRLDEKFRQQLKVSVSVGGEMRILNFNNLLRGRRPPRYGDTALLTDTSGSVPLVDNFGWHRKSYFVRTVARSETPLDQEWVQQAHRKSLVFMVKRYSLEQLKKFNVIRRLNAEECSNS